MFKTNQKTTGIFSLLLLATIAVLNAGCNNASSSSAKRQLISFKPIQGISYSEVQRLQKNGLALNAYGYQLEPQWQINFVSDDSARIYSPIKKQFLNFPLSRGYDSVFNTARAWLKVKKMNKDSLILEILKAKNDSIEINGSKVYMVFYADNYIKNVLHSDTSILRRPSRRDTQFVKSLVIKANKDITKAFAARHPVQLISKSPLVTATQQRIKPDLMNNFDTATDYLSPEFDINIDKAYADFYYSFTVCVDDRGEMHYLKPLIDFSMVGEEAAKSYIHLSQSVMDSYLKYYLKVIPGTTLGFMHASNISLHVQGNKK